MGCAAALPTRGQVWHGLVLCAMSTRGNGWLEAAVASCHHSLHSFVSIVPVQKPHSVPPVRAFLSVMVAADLPGFGHLSGSIL